MSEQISVITNVNFGGKTATIQKTLTCDSVGENNPNETAPAAKVGVLSTRTSHTAGVFAKTTHGILDSATVALFWTGGKRYNVDVDSVDSNTITFSGGAGDNLPTEAAAISLVQMIQLDVALNGTNLQGICLIADQDFIVSVVDSTGADLLVAERSANDSYLWTYGGGDNPVTGHTDVTAVNFYNKSITTAASVKAIYAKNNTLNQV